MQSLYISTSDLIKLAILETFLLLFRKWAERESFPFGYCPRLWKDEIVSFMSLCAHIHTQSFIVPRIFMWLIVSLCAGNKNMLIHHGAMWEVFIERWWLWWVIKHFFIYNNGFWLFTCSTCFHCFDFIAIQRIKIIFWWERNFMNFYFFAEFFISVIKNQLVNSLELYN